MKTKILSLLTLTLISLQVFAQEPGSGNTLDFDGNNDHIDASANAWYPNDQVDDYTYEAWIKLDNVTGNHSVVDYAWDVNTSEPHSLLWVVNGALQTRQRNQGAGSYFVNMSGGTIVANQWTHVALTKVGLTYTIYINGISVNSSTVGSIPGTFTGRNKFLIGTAWNSSAYQAGTTLDGNIDEVRIWKKGLTQTELRNWMCKKVTSSHPQFTDLAHYYKLDEGTGTALADETGTNNTSTHANFGPNPTWETSGAAIGDASSNSYGVGNSTFLNQAHLDGSRFILGEFTGTPDGAHLYLVNDTMNSTINTLSGDIEPTRYYGTFIVGGTSPSYTVQYLYSGNTNLDGIPNESETRFVKRGNNSITNWSTSSNEFDLSTGSNVIQACGQTGNSEYAAGFDNGAALIQRTGSGYALTFDGTNDYVNGSRTMLLNGLTYSAWIKTTSTDATSNYAGNSANTIIGDLHNDIWNSFGIHNGVVRYSHNNGSWQNVSSTQTVNDGKWHHVAITHDQSSGAIIIYIDGINAASGNIGYGAGGGAAKVAFGEIGGSYNAGTVPGDYFDGEIDEVAIYNKPLSQGAIRAWMCKKNNAGNPSYCNLVSYYRFDENTGTTLTDYKGNNNGTLTNGPTYTLSGAAIGDESTHSYGSGNSTSVTETHTDGSNLNIHSFTGAPLGAHVYLVNDTMNSTTNSLSGDLEQTRYYGTFIVGGSSPTYNTQYNYAGNTNLNGVSKEDEIRFVKRANNSEASWVTSSKAFDVNTSGNSVFVCGQTGNSEYATGFDNSVTLIQRPGSGYAMEFNGSHQYVSVPHHADFTLTSFTVSAWVKTTQGSGNYHRIVSKPNGGGQNYSLAVHLGKAHIRFDNGAGREAQGTTNINDGKWHFIAGTFDKATNTIKIYVDGVMENSALTGSNNPTTSTQALHIGRFSTQYANNFLGKVDEVSIYNEALTQTEIRDWMCKKTTSSHPSICNLVAYYRFDENTGTTLTDYNGNHNGTLFGNPAYALSGAAIGDESIHAYSVTTSTPALNYTTQNGDDMTAKLTAGTADAMQMYYVNEAPNITTPPSGFSNISGIGHWGVKLFGSTGGMYEVEYNYDGHIGINNEATLGMASRDNNADLSWAKESSATLNTSANTITLGGQTGTQFILGGGPLNPLPVELIEFNTILVNNTTQLNWKTASEINNDYFTIERSIDGQNFIELKVVKSKGISNSIQTYIEFDENPITGVNYYRLKQTDFNGEITYSNIRTITLTSNSGISIYPNPTKDIVNIHSKTNLLISSLTLTTVDGKIIKQFSNIDNNFYKITVLQNGIYFIQIEFADGTRKVERLIKK